MSAFYGGRLTMSVDSLARTEFSRAKHHNTRMTTSFKSCTGELDRSDQHCIEAPSSVSSVDSTLQDK